MQTRDGSAGEQRPKKPVPKPVLVGLLFGLAVLIAAFLFINSPYFTVSAVVVEGNKYMTSDDVCRVAGIPADVNIFRLSTGEIRGRLVRDLRVAEAEVNRRFPGTIGITIKERQPLAYVASSYGFVQLDRQGTVLAAFKNIKQTDLPIITGTRVGSIYVGDKAETGPLKNVLLYLAELDETTLGQLSEVNVRPAGDLVAYTAHTVTIRIGPPERLPEKARFTQDVLRDIGEKRGAVEYIDLNFAAPYIKFRQTAKE